MLSVLIRPLVTETKVPHTAVETLKLSTSPTLGRRDAGVSQSPPERVASPSSPSGHSRVLSPAHLPSPLLGLSLTFQCGAETALKTGDGMDLTGSKFLASSSLSISPIPICLSHGPGVGSHIPASQHPFTLF